MALLGAPAAEGLFHKAIAFSGSETVSPPADQLSAIVAHLGVEDDAEALERLMAMPSDDLAALQLAVGFYAGTSLDGTVITRPSCEAIVDGGAAVPVMAGATRDEGTFLAPHYAFDDGVVEAMVFGLAASIGRDDGEAYRAFLDETVGLAEPVACLERAWFDLFRASAVRVAATASAHGAGGWVYDFEVDTDHELGVTHFADVPFTFNWIREGHPREFVHPSTEANKALADAWSSTVIEFARSGSPVGRGLPDWPRFEAPAFRSLRVTHEPAVVSRSDGDLLDLYRAEGA